MSGHSRDHYSCRTFRYIRLCHLCDIVEDLKHFLMDCLCPFRYARVGSLHPTGFTHRYPGGWWNSMVHVGTLYPSQYARELCTPPTRGDRNSVPLPPEVTGTLYPSPRTLYPSHVSNYWPLPYPFAIKTLTKKLLQLNEMQKKTLMKKLSAIGVFATDPPTHLSAISRQKVAFIILDGP